MIRIHQSLFSPHPGAAQARAATATTEGLAQRQPSADHAVPGFARSQQAVMRAGSPFGIEASVTRKSTSEITWNWNIIENS